MLVQRCSAHAFNRFAGNFAAFSQSDDDDLDDDDEILKGLFYLISKGGTDNDIAMFGRQGRRRKHGKGWIGGRPVETAANIVELKHHKKKALFENNFGGKAPAVLEVRDKTLAERGFEIKGKKPIPSQGNIRVALEQLDVTVKHDAFQDLVPPSLVWTALIGSMIAP
jgi:hypothetical protein